MNLDTVLTILNVAVRQTAASKILTGLVEKCLEICIQEMRLPNGLQNASKITATLGVLIEEDSGDRAFHKPKHQLIGRLLNKICLLLLEESRREGDRETSSDAE